MHIGARALVSAVIRTKEALDVVTTDIATDLQELLGTLLKVKASVGAHKRSKSSGYSL